MIIVLLLITEERHFERQVDVFLLKNLCHEYDIT